MGKPTTTRTRAEAAQLAKEAKELAQDGLYAFEGVSHDVKVLRETLLSTVEALEEAGRNLAEMDVSLTVVRILLARMGVSKEQFDQMRAKVHQVRSELEQAGPLPVVPPRVAQEPPLPDLLADRAQSTHHPVEAFIFGS